MSCFESGEIPEDEGLTVAAAACALDIPARRLRRELAAAGTSFRDLIKDNRFAYARRKLRHTGESLDTIAADCGFSMPSAFYRAFKEWAGTTPTQYREQYRPSAKLVKGEFGRRKGADAAAQQQGGKAG